MRLSAGYLMVLAVVAGSMRAEGSASVVTDVGCVPPATGVIGEVNSISTGDRMIGVSQSAKRQHVRSTSTGLFRPNPDTTGVRTETSGTAAAPQSIAREHYVRGQVIVRFRTGVYEATIATVCSVERVAVIKRGRFVDYHLLKIQDDRSVEDAVMRLSARSEVEFAEPNYIATAHWTPNDPMYKADQWNLRRSGALDMQLAWELTTGASNVTVAVIDAGVAYEDYPIPSHEVGQVYSPDGRYHRAPDLASTFFVQGYDCISEDNHPNDQQGHGTHVAGTVAQSTNNGLGVAGMAYRCGIMPVRVLDNTGRGPSTAIAEGISYAWQHGARVLNLSLGSPWPDSNHLVHLAIIEAVNAGAVVVAAAGNSGVGHVGYPAAFPECFSVGAVDWYWQKTPYSNWGQRLDFVAPGGDTRSQNYWPIYQNTYAEAGNDPPINVSTFAYKPWQGTSMAAPHVSALVAMMMSRGITGRSAIKSRLAQTAYDLGSPGRDTLYGYGLIEPVRALGGVPEFHTSDDYFPDSYYYMNDATAKFAVACAPTLAAPFNITEAQALVWDRGTQRQFRMTINPASGAFPNMNENLAGPVTFTTVGDNSTAYWYHWDFTGVPRTTGSLFFVVFHWTTGAGPFVGGDTAGIANRSAYYTSSSGWRRTSDYNFYLRAISLKDTLSVGIGEPQLAVASALPTGIACVLPQPASGRVAVRYSAQQSGRGWYSLTDAAGRVVVGPKSFFAAAGEHDLLIEPAAGAAAEFAAGVYFLRLRLGDGTFAHPVVFAK